MSLSLLPSFIVICSWKNNQNNQNFIARCIVHLQNTGRENTNSEEREVHYHDFSMSHHHLAKSKPFFLIYLNVFKSICLFYVSSKLRELIKAFFFFNFEKRSKMKSKSKKQNWEKIENEKIYWKWERQKLARVVGKTVHENFDLWWNCYHSDTASKSGSQLFLYGVPLIWVFMAYRKCL